MQDAKTMYAYNSNVAQQRTQKSAELEYLGLWASNELTKLGHLYGISWVLLKHGSGNVSEQCFKCVVPASGYTYFLFPPSVSVEKGDVIIWGSHKAREEEWKVISTNRFRDHVRCEVRRPHPTDLEIDQLLRGHGLTEAADYLSNARARLTEQAPAASGDCIANCRNALQSAVREWTHEGELGEGLRKLKDVCDLGKTEAEFAQALEKLFLASRSLLSKSGAHPPMPDQPLAVFVLDVTTATLRFLVATHKPAA